MPDFCMDGYITSIDNYIISISPTITIIITGCPEGREGVLEEEATKLLIDEGEKEELREALHVEENRGKQFHEVCIHACVCLRTKVGFHY